MVPRLNKGVFVPVPTFFDENEDLDLESIDKHVQFLSKTGISGIVVLDSMSEVDSLTEDERAQVISQYAQSAQKHDPSLQVVVSLRARGAKLTSLRLRQAKDAGAGFVLLCPPSYKYSSINNTKINQYYSDIIKTSPIPIAICNYSSNPLESDHFLDAISDLARRFDIAGIVINDKDESEMIRDLHKVKKEEIPIFGGSIEYFAGDMENGADGIFIEMGIIFPSLCVDLQKKLRDGNVKEALELKNHICGFEKEFSVDYRITIYKSLFNSFLGYGKGIVRGPLESISDEDYNIAADVLRSTYEMENAFQLKKH